MRALPTLGKGTCETRIRSRLTIVISCKPQIVYHRVVPADAQLRLKGFVDASHKTRGVPTHPFVWARRVDTWKARLVELRVNVEHLDVSHVQRSYLQDRSTLQRIFQRGNISVDQLRGKWYMRFWVQGPVENVKPGYTVDGETEVARKGRKSRGSTVGSEAVDHPEYKTGLFRRLFGKRGSPRGAAESGLTASNLQAPANLFEYASSRSVSVSSEVKQSRSSSRKSTAERRSNHPTRAPSLLPMPEDAPMVRD